MRLNQIPTNEWDDAMRLEEARKFVQRSLGYMNPNKLLIGLIYILDATIISPIVSELSCELADLLGDLVSENISLVDGVHIVHKSIGHRSVSERSAFADR